MSVWEKGTEESWNLRVVNNCQMSYFYRLKKKKQKCNQASNLAPNYTLIKLHNLNLSDNSFLKSLWDTSSCIFHFFASFANRGTKNLFWTIFSKIFMQQIALKDTDGVSLQSREGFAQYNKNNGSFWGKGQAHSQTLWTFKLSKLGALLLKCKPLSIQASPPRPLHLPCGSWTTANADNLSASLAINNKVICLWPRSLLSSASSHETCRQTCELGRRWILTLHRFGRNLKLEW